MPRKASAKLCRSFIGRFARTCWGGSAACLTALFRLSDQRAQEVRKERRQGSWRERAWPPRSPHVFNTLPARHACHAAAKCPIRFPIRLRGDAFRSVPSAFRQDEVERRLREIESKRTPPRVRLNSPAADST